MMKLYQFLKDIGIPEAFIGFIDIFDQQPFGKIRWNVQFICGCAIMDHINADSDIREAAFGRGNKSSVHVTCEITHPASHIDGVTIKVFHKTREVDRREYVNDASRIAIRYAAMILADVPVLFRRFPLSGIPLKFIDTQGMRKLIWTCEINRFQDIDDDALCDTVLQGDFPYRMLGYESTADISS